MKPLSDKFANLGQSGIARRVAVETSTVPRAEAFVEQLKAEVQEITNAEAVKRSRVKSSRYRDYQRDYMRKWRAAKPAKSG